MANSYTQNYIQYVIAPKWRKNILLPSFDERLRKYMTGLVQKRKSKMIAINNVTDHLHFFIGLHPTISVSKMIQEVKGLSSKFINDNKFIKSKFQWQDGYGAFSYSRSAFSNVIRYIENQQEHHKKQTFKEEYFEFLTKFEVDFKNKYLFEFYE